MIFGYLKYFILNNFLALHENFPLKLPNFDYQKSVFILSLLYSLITCALVFLYLQKKLKFKQNTLYLKLNQCLQRVYVHMYSPVNIYSFLKGLRMVSKPRH